MRFSTPSNFWDWACHNEGCCTTKSLTPPARCEQHGYAKAPPAAWAEFVRAAKFKEDGASGWPATVYDLNVVQTNASYQVEGLKQFVAQGLPVELVEFGNELYDPQQNQGACSHGP